MERVSTCDLRNKEIINLCDGSRLGCPTDFEFCVSDGKITAIIIEGPGGFLGFGKNDNIIIPWSQIECVGEDAILVKLSPSECCCTNNSKKKRRGYW